jgi:S1-C subfamily serine protease
MTTWLLEHSAGSERCDRRRYQACSLDMAPSSPDPLLDGFSEVVTAVAEAVTPVVASLRLRGAAGSAVVFTHDGFLLTNAHVVGTATGGRVDFADGTGSEFRVIGTDPLSDLAVIRALGPTPAPAVLGEASSLRLGQLVLAVGNPLGLTGSVSTGVVSGLGRSLPTRADGNVRIIDDVIQTDAALNPGSSGGALATSDGAVVGINTAVAGIGVGLAIPINDSSRTIIASLIADGRVHRGYLGLAGTPVPLPPIMAERLGRDSGLRIVEVVSGSPAAHADIRVGDIALTVDGQPISSAQQLQRLMVARPSLQSLSMTLLRKGALVDVRILPTELTAAA